MDKTAVVDFLVDNLLDCIQAVQVVESNLVFELIGKLEHAKLLLLGSVGRTIVAPRPSSLQQQVATPLVSAMNVQVPTPGITVQRPPAPVITQPSPLSRPRVNWQTIDENQFTNFIGPSFWCEMALTSTDQQRLLPITQDNLSILENASPLDSFIRSPYFQRCSIPVVLRSTKIVGLPFTGVPGLLHHLGRPGCGAELIWPALGELFVPPVTIQLSYLWRVSWGRYMLHIGVTELGPTVGTSNVGPSDGGAIAGKGKQVA